MTRVKIRTPRVVIPAWCAKAGKVAHDSKSAAKAHVRALRSRPDCIDGELLHAYRCMSHWHVGHRARRVA